MTDDAPQTIAETILAIRIPKELRARIKTAAQRKERTESSFARYYLGRAADEVIGSAAEGTRIEDEDPAAPSGGSPEPKGDRQP
jgi:predicted DNA-binding protein